MSIHLSSMMSVASSRAPSMIIFAARASPIPSASDAKGRAIAVDIRYVLFILDKFGGAGYLLKELDIKNAPAAMRRAA